MSKCKIRNLYVRLKKPNAKAVIEMRRCLKLKRKTCDKDITKETVSTSAIEQSRLHTLTLKEPTGMGAATIGIPAEDYKFLIEFVRLDYI